MWVPPNPTTAAAGGWCRWSLRPRQAEPGKRNEIHTRRGANDTHQLYIVRNSEKKKGWGPGGARPTPPCGPGGFPCRSFTLARSLGPQRQQCVCVLEKLAVSAGRMLTVIVTREVGFGSGTKTKRNETCGLHTSFCHAILCWGYVLFFFFFANLVC